MKLQKLLSNILNRHKNHIITLLILAGVIICQSSLLAQPKNDYKALRKRLFKLNKLDKQSELYNTISKLVMPSVVVVRTTRRVPMTNSTKKDKSGKRWKFYRFKIGQGSGFVVDAKKGYVLTSYHVVADAERLEVVLPDGRILKAYWMRGDKLTDIAVLRIPAEGLVATPLGDSDTIEIGHQVLAFGSPMGLPQTMTSGIVSAKSRQTYSARTSYQDFIQTDAAINRGNSGGPLVNMRGEVIGINSMILSETGMNAGIGLAIPSNMVHFIMNQLIKTGKVVRGYLGLQIQDISAHLAKNMLLPDNHGALVCNIIANSPAEQSGLQLEDFITAANGESIRNSNQIKNFIAAIRPGQTVTLDILRQGEAKKINIVVGKAKSKTVKKNNRRRPIDIKRQVGLLGKTLTPELAEKYKYPSDTKGLLITGVAFGSEAYDARLEKGMVITRINGREAKDITQLKNAIRLNMGKGMRLTVINQNGGRWLVLLPLEIIRINGGM